MSPARPAFRRHEAHAEGNDTTPMQKCKNNTVCKKKNPLKASRRNISFLCYKWKISLLRILFPISAEFSFYGSLITSLGGGQHRICLVCGEAAALPNALGGAWPHTPFSGRSPDPLEATPALRGDERNHFRKVIDYEKRYQIQHAHGVR